MSDGVGLRSDRGPILLALMLSTFLIAIDSTILATAVPTIVGEFGGFEQFPWLFSIYTLAQAASVPVYAKLSDVVGRRPVIYTGILLFLLGSVLCAMAWDMSALIAFRAVQGLGAGAIMPVAMTIAGDIYTVRERAKAQGYLASVWAVSAVVGPTIGGLFAQFLSWRWIFWINVPLCLIALWMLWRNYRQPFERHRQRIDYAGAVLLTAALVLLVLALLEGGNAWGWLSWQSLAAFGIGAALLVGFAFVERRAQDPILAPWVFSSRIVVSTSIVALLVGVVLIGLVSFVPTFLQATTAAVPLAAGLAVAALTLGWPLSAALAGRFYLRIGFRATTLLGSTLAILGAALLVVFALAPSIVLTAVGCFVVGLGLGLVAAPSLIAAQSSVDMRRRGVVSGTNMLARSVGSAVGVAVFGAIANALIASGGGSDVPAAIQSGSIAVFVGVAVSALIMLVACAFIPPVRIEEHEQAGERETVASGDDGTDAAG
ncbi:MFS transporter [Microbacterium sp. BK668]|uniref:MFS transporter n=1 Tax=Microbacterium sp. BK668 TaxID=2512118 RepID=UPI0010613535|nr:MFS transporter [Microbacterium sp. BK668]TDN92318.1 EmrB/QacA subfamily drug resistance transporter [Microbacterium sp. BK668]